MIRLLRESLVTGGQVIALTQADRKVQINQSVETSLPLELTAPATVLVDVGQMVRAGFELDFEPHGETHLELRPRQCRWLGGGRVGHGTS